MGYFSNGSEGDDYERQHCDHCLHQKLEDGGCMVWLAHCLHNYRDCNDPDSVLHLLIPRSADDLSNERCTMFVASAAPRP